jgi:putative NADPH-quinone reductase
MTALVVHAHPSTESLSAELCRATQRGLRRGGHDVELIDLAHDGFTAAMTAEERRVYESDSPILDPLVERYAAAVGQASILAFVFPTWWFGPPALLKGFFDRVMVPGVAFGFDDNGRVSGRLGHVRRVAGVTTTGASRTEMRLATDGTRRMITRTLRLNTSRRCRRSWLALNGIETADAASISQFIRLVEDKAARW